MTITKDEFLALSKEEQKELVLSKLDKRISETQDAINLYKRVELLEANKWQKKK